MRQARELSPDDPDSERSKFKGIGGRPRRSRLWLVAVAVAALFLAWPAWASFYTNWLWFKQLGYQSIFTTVLSAKVMPGVVAGLIAAAVAYFNFKLAMRLSPEPPVGDRFFEIEGQRVQAPNPAEIVSKLAIPAAIVIGAFAGMMAWNAWDIFLLYRHQAPFGEADPVFGRDVAYYFFTLPALEVLSRLLFVIVAASLVGTGLIYATRSIDFGGEGRFRLWIGRGPRAHLLGLAAALFMAFALRAYLEMPNLVYSTTGPVAGASYTDLAATLPLLRVEAAAAALLAILAVASIFREKNGLLWVGAGLYLLALAAVWIYPAVVQRFSVAPNEFVRETPYIERNIAATRKAFALDRVEEREISGEKTVTAGDIQKNQRTVNNIRLWDQRPLLDTFAQIQEIRPYYEFQSVDNDRYRINGELQQVMLSPRELSSASLPSRNWINERLSYTHGFGLTLGPVNQVTQQGLPVLFIQDIPPTSSIPTLKVDRPEIYFGELASDRVYVRTKAREFNYPAGEENAYSSFEGEGGVSIGSFWRQLLFATRFGDLKLLLSDDLTPESRVLFYRDIRERLGHVAPFLRFDNDPYVVISEGRLFWIADAYTTSNRYPYSQPVGDGINYIRNSVKAVVDAYHGHVQLYIADEGDPLIQTYARIFPNTLRPLSEMPAGLREHLRYPEDIFKAQLHVYSTYHMDNPQVFYNREDQWTVPTMSGGQEGNQQKEMEPYYTIMKLPGHQTEEFIQMLPFTPKNKDNLAAWMVARADGENYGKLVAYRFPKQKLVFGPKQVVARINQDPEISRQVSLWSQRGSSVEFGTLMVIPIEESLIYVQPLYLRSESVRIPELRRVIVADENRIAMEPTLEASLSRVFGSAPAPEMPAEEVTLAQQAQTGTVQAAPQRPALNNLASQAMQHYERMTQAQREGDWARYGEELKQLGAVINQMSRQK